MDSLVTEEDVRFLRRAIELARRALELGHDPFGAVLAAGGAVAHEGFDRSVEASGPTYHAELAVISKYCRSHRRFTLDGYSLYCSAEPCVMCSGAIHWSHISRVVYSVSQEKLQEISGGRSKPRCIDLINIGRRQVQVIGPLLEDEGLLGVATYGDMPRKPERHRRRLNTNDPPFDQPSRPKA
jgi:tRNA(Arg) A34 adenosine deaminase TadA